MMQVQSWVEAVRAAPALPELTVDEKRELQRVLTSKLFMKAAALVYESAKQKALNDIMLGNVDPAGLVSTVTAPNVVFGALWELTNE